MNQIPDRSEFLLPDPNWSAALEFFATLAPTSDQHVFQTLDDFVLADGRKRKDTKLTKVLIGTFAQHRSELAHLNASGAGIYVTVNETDGKGRRAENITRVRAIWQEDDGGHGAPAGFPEPHLVVETSPGRFHRYWLVNITPDEFRALMRLMVERFGSDKNAADIARVLRVPGFYHRKDESFLTRIERVADDLTPLNRNDLDWPEAAAALVKPKAEKPASVASSAPPRAFDRATIFSALGYIRANDDRKTWLLVGMALKHAAPDDDEGYSLWNEWSKTFDPYDEEDQRRTWDSLKHDGGVTLGTLFHLARQNGWRRRDVSGGMSEIEPPPRVDLRFKLIFTSDISFDAIRERRESALVAGLCHRGQLGMIYGHSTDGKSFVALDMAYCIAHGLPWQDLKTRQGPVLYVCMEGAGGFQERIKAVEKLYGDAGDFFAMLPGTVSLAPDSSGDAGVREIVEAARELERRTGQPLAAVYLDTIQHAMPGVDENDTKDMNAVVVRTQQLRSELGAAIIGIHHANSNGDPRGSKVLFASCDFVINVRRTGKLREAYAKKDKDGDERSLFKFELQRTELGSDSSGKQYSSAVVATVHAGLEAAAGLKPVKREPQFQRGFRAAIAACQARGKWKGEAVVRLLASEVEAEFHKSYPTGQGGKQKDGTLKRYWRMLTAAAPDGFELSKCPADGQEYFIYTNPSA